MGYDSLVAVGLSHPQYVLGGRIPQPVLRPTEFDPPPNPAIAVEPAVDTDHYLGPPPPVPARGYLYNVRLHPGKVRLHAGWSLTAIGNAMDASHTLDLHKITPAMLRSLPRRSRIDLMTRLASVKEYVRWCDARGSCTSRKRILGVPTRRIKVNAATGLVMRMAEVNDRTAFRDALLDGLPVVVHEIQGYRGGRQFAADDVAYVVTEVLHRVIVCKQARLATDYLKAASTLIRHYIQQESNERSRQIQTAMRVLMQALGTSLPRDPAHIGLAFGIVLGGTFQYVGSLASMDFRKRWQVASLANMIWAAQNFVPIFYASGAIASVVVGTAILWDYRHPPRDYTDIVRRFESEFLLVAAQGRLGMTLAQVLEMKLWMEIALRANNF